MNNNIIQLGRCVLIVLLSGLTVLATAQVKTNQKIVSVETKTSETTTINQNADFQGPIGIVPLEFVIEDDIMQSKDGEEGDNKNGNTSGNATNPISDVKSTNFTTSTLSQLAREIKVYPIPAKTFTNIDLGSVKVKELSIVNSIGQKVDSQTIDQQFLRLDISNYQTGIYFIQLTTAGNQVVTKTIMIN